MLKVSLLLAGPERSGGPASNNGRPTPDPSFGSAVVCSRVPILLGLFHPVTQNVELQDDAVVHKSTSRSMAAAVVMGSLCHILFRSDMGSSTPRGALQKGSRKQQGIAEEEGTLLR
jgi:hypothetical protein